MARSDSGRYHCIFFLFLKTKVIHWVQARARYVLYCTLMYKGVTHVLRLIQRTFNFTNIKLESSREPEAAPGAMRLLRSRTMTLQ